MKREDALMMDDIGAKRKPKKSSKVKKSSPPERPQHPCARSHPEMRRSWQESEEASAVLARRDHVNVKTVRKHRDRRTVDDLRMGPPSTGPLCLQPDEVNFVLHYREWTNLSTRLCHENLRAQFPKLSLSALSKWYARNGLGRLGYGRTETAREEYRIAQRGIFAISTHNSGGFRCEGGLVLFAAIEEGTGRVFCRRAHATHAEAAKFFEALCEHFSEHVHYVRVQRDEIFGRAPTEMEDSFPKAMNRRQVSSIPYSFEAGFRIFEWRRSRG
jgi:hypothetical protein